MKPLFTEEKLKSSKSEDLLPCECQYCKKTFYLTKHEIQTALNPNHGYKGKYCSKKCHNSSQISKIIVKCNNCGKEFRKLRNQAERSKNHFCSRSCAAIYNNTHKTKGNRRSKLEIYLEKKLKELYPELKIDFNQTNIINAELDIYIDFLKIAFELNGVFHYEPIYGKDKLKKIQNNDSRKFQACLENGIELCIIDTTQQKYFKEQTSKKFLEIIVNIINKKLVGAEEFESPYC
jgi:hypothetical protein